MATAPRKHSEDSSAVPTLTDKVLGLDGTPSNKNFTVANLKAATQKDIQLDPASTPAYSAYQIWADASNGCITADTAFSGVRCCIGFENYIPVYNDTGVTITNGTPVMNATGTYASGVPSVTVADADNPLAAIAFLGVATQDIAPGAVGAATYFGAVNGVNTSGLSQGAVFLASGGGLTNTAPAYPAVRLLVGGATVIDPTSGVLGVNPVIAGRTHLTGSYSFTSQGVTSGTFWKGGYYTFSDTSTTRTQAAPSLTYGTPGKTYAAHVGIVAAGPGTVDTGQVGLRVRGILDSETGPQTSLQTQVITTDITTLTANNYYETVGKFSGQVTIELYVVSGSPTAYSLSFNYGYAKYEDFGNQDFTISYIEAVWRGAQADSTFNVQLLKHDNTGWTYAASGFVPGNGVLASRLVDQSLAPDVTNGGRGAWKRINLNEYINGTGSEGYLIKIDTGTNNSIQTMDITVSAYSEGLV